MPAGKGYGKATPAKNAANLGTKRNNRARRDESGSRRRGRKRNA